MKQPPGEDFRRPWPPLIKMVEAVKAKVESSWEDAIRRLQIEL